MRLPAPSSWFAEAGLDRLAAVQQRLLDMAAGLVKPGGCLVYAVCSLLSREGAGQIDRFLEHRSSWISETVPIAGGRSDGAGRLLTPGHDRTDGFFVARLRRPC
jgi:16S rRNA (cytosine967-C5)-methyltransferase